MTINGRIPDSELRVLPGFLPYAASANFRPVTEKNFANQILASIYTDAANMAMDFEAACHQQLTYAEAYREDEVQDWRIEEHKHGGPLAAPVVNGEHTSNHGLGLAVDYRNGIGGGPGNSTYDWMHVHAADYGFYEDVHGEHWHWHHPLTHSITQPRNATAGTGTQTPIEDDMPLNDADKDYIKSTIRTQLIQILRADEFAKIRNDQIAVQVAKRVPDAIMGSPITVNDGKGGQITGTLAQAIRDTRNGVYLNNGVLGKIAALVAKLAAK